MKPNLQHLLLAIGIFSVTASSLIDSQRVASQQACNSRNTIENSCYEEELINASKAPLETKYLNKEFMKIKPFSNIYMSPIKKAMENVNLCIGDGNGALITSSRDSKAQVKVCGRDSDLIRYWYDGTSIVYDPIRDGDGLNANDVKFPTAPNTPDLPRPPVAVRHGRDRDLVRIYTPPKAGKSAMVTRYEPRNPNYLSIGWLAIDKVEVAGVKFVYNAGKNAFVREGVPISDNDIRPIGGS